MTTSNPPTNPPDLSTLNYDSREADLPDVNFNGESGLSESEKAINDKFQKQLPRVPNYTKNPELELEETVKELKGNGDLQKFKKDVPVPVQKHQSKIKENNEPTITDDVIKQHLDKMSAIAEQGSTIGQGPAKLPPQNMEVSSAAEMQSALNTRGMNCKFLSSDKCHKDYPNFSGASITFDGGMKMKCDSTGDQKAPKAVCTIKNGKIDGVYLIKHGAGITKPPKVEAVGGGGKGAVFKAILENGKIKDILVVDSGEGYHETPTIKIEDPNLSEGCYLCCK